MTSPTIANLFQIGVDNTMIQVPQNYTVPANPPSEPNPPSDTSIATNPNTTTTKDSVTVYVSSNKGFSNPLTISFFIKRMDSGVDPSIPITDRTIVPADGDPLPILIGSTHSDWITGTWDAINLGWKGTFSFTLQPSTALTSALNTYAATNFKTLWINPGSTGGTIDPNHPPAYQVTLYATDNIGPSPSNTFTSCSFIIVVMPNVAIYGLGIVGEIPSAMTNIRSPILSGVTTIPVNSTMGFQKGDSIVINPLDSSHSDVVTITSISGTPAAPTFVVTPGTANNHSAGEDVVTITSSFGNTVALKSSSGNYADVTFFFYPLESTLLVPNEEQVSVAISINTFGNDNTGGGTGIIDTTKSLIFSPFFLDPRVAFSSYTNGTLQLPAGFTRDFPSNPVKVHLELNANAVPVSTDPTKTRALFQITGTDTNGVIASAYIVIQVIA